MQDPRDQVVDGHMRGLCRSTPSRRTSRKDEDLMDQIITPEHVRGLIPWTGAAALVSPEPWMQEALCAETDPEAFFPEKGGSTREAKKVCARCDVTVECLAFALRTKQDEGIWGGKSARELAKIRKASAA